MSRKVPQKKPENRIKPEPPPKPPVKIPISPMTKHDWIPVSEPPIENDMVLVYCECNHYSKICVGFHKKKSKTELLWYRDWSFNIISPTHWMPLPEPPKEWKRLG